jgi:hypothetical protein
MRVSGLGERGSRLRVVAARLKPAPAIPPFFVQLPDATLDEQVRAVGWYMRRTREGPPVFLGHSAAAAEVWLRIELGKQQARTSVRKRSKKRNGG